MMGKRVVWMVGVVTVTAVLAVTVTFVPAANAQSVATAKQKALSYFHSKQSKAGGFKASSSGQAASLTPWVVQAIAAAGKNPSTFKKSGGKGPIAYLQSLNIDSQATSGSGTTRNPATVYAKLIITYRAAKVPSLISKAGSKHVDLVKRLLTYRNNKSGCFTTSSGGTGSYAAISTTTWAMIALKAAGYGSSQLATSVTWLKNQQASSGGFSYTPGGSPDTDSTAAAVEALRAGGVSPSTSTIKRAVSYLHSQQKSNGGFTSGMGATTNAESTAWAVQAIRAVGQSPTGASWKKSGRTPITFMLSLQASSGAFYHYGTTLALPLGTTAQVIVALSGKKYPF